MRNLEPIHPNSRVLPIPETRDKLGIVWTGSLAEKFAEVLAPHFDPPDTGPIYQQVDITHNHEGMPIVTVRR